MNQLASFSGAPATGFLRDDDPVILGHPLVTARFGDDEWDLTALDHHDGREAHVSVISFGHIQHPAWKRAAKELAYHRLNTRLASEIRQVSAYTCSREQTRLKRFLRWLGQYHPRIASPAQLTQLVVHAYKVWLEDHGDEARLPEVSGGNNRKAKTVSGETVWSYMSPIKSLDMYRDFLSDPIPFRPYGGKLTAGFCGFHSDRAENSTPPIPDEILHPVFSTALRYVQHYHRDIQDMVRDVLAFWDQITPTNYVLWPGWTAAISDCPEFGRPWRPALGTAKHHANHEFRAEISHLIAACTVVILYLSGMRPGELTMLRVNCLRRVRDPHTGDVIRWKIRGFPLKKGKKAGHKPVEWVIPQAAAEAVEVLEQVLQPFRERHGTDYLALSLDAFKPFPERPRRGFSFSERSLRGRLINFVEMIGARFDAPINYPLQPSQFRRTLARHIARQPFGIIAGKLQYNHVRTAIFEGYAGTVHDGFRLEVADEELLAHVDLLEEMQTDADDGFLLGPGASTLLTDYQNAKSTAVSAAQIDASAGGIALTAAIKSVARRVHVGFLNYCSFKADTAFCLTPKEAGEADAAPKINQCSPDKCANAVIGRCHIPLWQELQAEVEQLTASTPRTGPQRTSLNEQAKRYQRLLKGHGSG